MICVVRALGSWRARMIPGQNPFISGERPLILMCYPLCAARSLVRRPSCGAAPDREGDK